MNKTGIAPGIYDLGGGYFKAGHSKAYLIDSGDGLILIDTLYDGDAKVILDEIARLGRTPNDLKHILMTHGHRGHMGGLATMKELSGAPIYSHPWEADIIAGDRVPQAVDLWTFDPIQSWPIIFFGQITYRWNKHKGRPVDLLIGDGDQVGPLQVIHTPGHTPGHLVFYWPERKALFTGDAFVTWPKICPGWDNSMLNRPQSWDSLARMAALDVDIICTGHGDPITSGGAAVMRELLARRP
jgi:glyoxylase-like metal-dependent hydrolase (beta-lactamase superfamily II)